MDEQKRPRAWVYARIPGDYDGTMNSYKVGKLLAGGAGYLCSTYQPQL